MKVETKDLFTKKSYMQFAEELKPQFPTSFPFEYPENYYKQKAKEILNEIKDRGLEDVNINRFSIGTTQKLSFNYKKFKYISLSFSHSTLYWVLEHDEI